MLTLLFLLAAAVLIAAVFRRPRALWQRAVVVVAGIVMLAVLIAWGIELLVFLIDAR